MIDSPHYSYIKDEICWELNNEPKWHKRIPWKSGMRKLEGVEFPENVIHLLQHNDTPSPAQLFELKEYQHKSTVGYPAIRDEIASIDEQIERLSKRRATLKDAEKPYLKKIFACDVILSPIRSIPNEILRKIFSHSIPPHPSPTKGTPPVSLTRVCALWRQIALTMPELWTEIAVIYGSFVNSKKAIARLTHFTKRSRNLPLNIHLVLPDNNNLSSVFHNTLRFFTTKWSEIGRVRCLDIYSSQMWQTLPALHNNAPPMENLESLTVRGGDYDRSLDSASSASSEPEDARNTHIGNFLLHAPHLTKLSICFGALGDSILDEKYASSMWSHLTCLYIRDPLDLERWRVIIRLCPTFDKRSST
ncbi:hypothetical protein BDZ97DRAFT_2074323 [Flammula alnicola]|nr:hypothetical protein BDZ97DRAFT_2074323 [Flammula alnicola]